MRVNSALAFLGFSALFSGCMVGMTPVVQYGPLTVEMGPQGGPAGPPTPTPPPTTPQIVSVVASPGQESYALIAFFPSDVWDYYLVSVAVTQIGTAPTVQNLGILAHSGATTSLVVEAGQPVAAGRYLAQLTYAKGRFTEFKPPAEPVWHEPPERMTLSYPFEIAP